MSGETARGMQLRLERRGACVQGPPKKREAPAEKPKPAKADGPAVPKKRRVAVVSDGESDAAASSSDGSSGDAEVRECTRAHRRRSDWATHICAGTRTAGRRGSVSCVGNDTLRRWCSCG